MCIFLRYIIIVIYLKICFSKLNVCFHFRITILSALVDLLLLNSTINVMLLMQLTA